MSIPILPVSVSFWRVDRKQNAVSRARSFRTHMPFVDSRPLAPTQSHPPLDDTPSPSKIFRSLAPNSLSLQNSSQHCAERLGRRLVVSNGVGAGCRVSACVRNGRAGGDGLGLTFLLAVPDKRCLEVEACNGQRPEPAATRCHPPPNGPWLQIQQVAFPKITVGWGDVAQRGKTVSALRYRRYCRVPLYVIGGWSDPRFWWCKA